jgi:hypothetical protein
MSTKRKRAAPTPGPPPPTAFLHALREDLKWLAPKNDSSTSASAPASAPAQALRALPLVTGDAAAPLVMLGVLVGEEEEEEEEKEKEKEKPPEAWEDECAREILGW